MNKTAAFAALLLVAGLSPARSMYHNAGTLDGQEKGDILYRELPPGFVDYHAGVFEGFYMGTYEDAAFGGPHPTLGVMDITFESASTSGPTTMTFEGKTLYKQVSRRPGVVNWFRISYPGAVHSKANMDLLRRGMVQMWGKRAAVPYKGAFTNTEAVGSGLLNPSKRAEIIDELFYLRERDGNDRWNYEFVNMVNYEWNRCGWMDLWLCSYFRSLNDVEDARCDFVPEWVYEKRGVAVWGKDANLKWISGGHTDHADYHNDALDENSTYNLGELSPAVQSGDFYMYDRDSRSRTALRPSQFQAPTVVFFGQTAQGSVIHVKDNASERVIYSVVRYNPDGTFQDYAKDGSGQPYKYRELALPVLEAGARSAKIFPLLPDLGQKYYTVKLVVTDEGGNTTESVFDNSYVPPPAVPTLVEVYPDHGEVGRIVWVRGQDVSPRYWENKVFFNGQEAPVTEVLTISGSLRRMTVYVPAGVISGPVTISTLGVTAPQSFHFKADARVTAVHPSHALPGQLITIEGANFFENPADMRVDFTTGQRTSLRVAPETATRTRLTVRVPPEANYGFGLVIGLGPNPEGKFFNFPDYYDTDPSISSIVPSSARPGEEVVINGKDFHRSGYPAPGPESPKVTFSGVEATVLSFTLTSIRVRVPQASSGPVVVSRSHLVDSRIFSAGHQFYMTPTLSAISPDFGLPGETVTLEGKDFASDASGLRVMFGTVSADILSSSTTRIVCRVPAGAPTGNVIVQSWGVASQGRLFTMKPVLAALSRASGFPNSLVVLSGSNFSPVASENVVRFAGTPAQVVSASTTSLTVKVPRAKTGDVTVTRNNATSNGLRFKISSLAPILSLLL